MVNNRTGPTPKLDRAARGPRGPLADSRAPPTKKKGTADPGDGKENAISWCGDCHQPNRGL